MTVYELIQALVKYDPKAQIRFQVKGNLDFDTTAYFDRDDENDEQGVTVNVDLNDRFEFDKIRDWTRTSPKFIEIQLIY